MMHSPRGTHPGEKARLALAKFMCTQVGWNVPTHNLSRELVSTLESHQRFMYFLHTVHRSMYSTLMPPQGSLLVLDEPTNQ